ncbi:hypothetical protein SSS_08180 [Sarcoptes scabiei]|uniref:Uncharacterized protein n=1 Tax=Sarcoptes scabiei TaxID=52283 RepID=A0A834R1Y7_SARSC|nr:hypothetical protein SSS_08180 [Sarcoptes scabiei]
MKPYYRFRYRPYPPPLLSPPPPPPPMPASFTPLHPFHSPYHSHFNHPMYDPFYPQHHHHHHHQNQHPRLLPFSLFENNYFSNRYARPKLQLINRKISIQSRFSDPDPDLSSQSSIISVTPTTTASSSSSSPTSSNMNKKKLVGSLMKKASQAIHNLIELRNRNRNSRPRLASRLVMLSENVRSRPNLLFGLRERIQQRLENRVPPSGAIETSDETRGEENQEPNQSDDTGDENKIDATTSRSNEIDPNYHQNQNEIDENENNDQQYAESRLINPNQSEEDNNNNPHHHHRPDHHHLHESQDLQQQQSQESFGNQTKPIDYELEGDKLRQDIVDKFGHLQTILTTAFEVSKERRDARLRRLMFNTNNGLERAKQRADQILSEPSTSELAVKTLHHINNGFSNLNNFFHNLMNRISVSVNVQMKNPKDNSTISSTTATTSHQHHKHHRYLSPTSRLSSTISSALSSIRSKRHHPYHNHRYRLIRRA